LRRQRNRGRFGSNHVAKTRRGPGNGFEHFSHNRHRSRQHGNVSFSRVGFGLKQIPPIQIDAGSVWWTVSDQRNDAEKSCNVALDENRRVAPASGGCEKILKKPERKSIPSEPIGNSVSCIDEIVSLLSAT
jgi:hypothetical protein